jgi:XTP/dITP diphosphohydrolase
VRRRNSQADRATLVVASGNAGKLRELGILLQHVELTLRSIAEYPGAPLVEESGATYRENALIKALAAARHTGLAALADDSGIEVDALGGAPGVRSARFAGEPGDDRRNVAKLLRRMRGVPVGDRGARFVCAIVVAKPDGRSLSVEGRCEGEIAFEPTGERGFGYDPIFFIPSLRLTLAQVSEKEKNRISHRAKACAELGSRLLPFLMA